MAKKNSNMLGAWAFLIGVILAVVLGVFESGLSTGVNQVIIILLVIAGILVGLLNITNKDSSRFLMAGLVLVIVTYMASLSLSKVEVIPLIGPALMGIFNALLILFVPATVIVALKSAFEVARD